MPQRMPSRHIGGNRTEEIDAYYRKIFGRLRAHSSDDEEPSRFPIQWLPPELLIIVMYWYIRFIYEQSKCALGGMSPYSWLTIRHVCRAWRDVALRTPELSTFICLTRLECVQEMMGLSLNLPIHVRERPSGGRRTRDPESFQILTLVMTNFARISTADLEQWINIQSYPPLPFPTLQPRMSAIRSLTWKAWVNYGGGSRHNASSSPILPNITFPNLEHLSCSWVRIPSIRHMLHSGLLHLELYEPSSISLPSLLAAMKDMSNLISLSICRLSISVIENNSVTAITLPRLQELVITYEGIGSTARSSLLQHIIYPATASISLTVPEEFFSSNVATLASKLNGSGVLGIPPELQTISIKCWGYEIELMLWNSPQCAEASQWLPHGDKPPSSRCQLRILFEVPEGSDWISTIMECDPISSIRAAYLSDNFYLGSSNRMSLRRLASSMPRLETLTLQYEIQHCPQGGGLLISNPTGPTDTMALNNEVADLFSQLKVVHIREDHLRYRGVDPSPTSDMYHFGQWLMASKDQSNSPFTDLYIEKTSICHASLHPCVTVRCDYRPDMGPSWSHTPYSHLLEDSGDTVGCRLPHVPFVSRGVLHGREFLTRSYYKLLNTKFLL
ncbi:hypothetical protein PHLGIDRAFT_485554 [Phlebiopsis gigantea 11061_1 CR5-6]|uniref:Uncharacterized protein n=1 Tax=Phlebiopsis gigantea (strain 11061_1 CR5-6) TaxID=745531 RepID=A0A0C3RW77_PHLG1|nr:hypothetical protein PHLGIDRAFT_485554 [Phlebiopsis gigantea 11061_1 CR5-6]